MKYMTKVVSSRFDTKTIPNQSGPMWIPKSHINSFM